MVIDSYDAVICSFGPVSSTILALWIKEHHPCKPLIMDFRDPMDSVTLPRKYKRLYGGLQKKICEKADAVVSVSDGCINRICPKKYKDKAYTVPNGYDPEDIGGDVLSAVYDNEKYSFAYTGALYGGKRSFAPLFKQLSSLINDGTIDRKNVIFRYAGKSFPALLEQAAQYGLEDILDNRGMITRDECLRLQRSARHLVVCTWNNRKETGVLTGKLMEYFMSGRPIIALVSGELGGSEVRRLIERGSLGIAYEQASGRTDGRLLRDYIKSDYLDFLSGKDCRSKRKEDVVSRYDYHALASGVKSVIEAAIGQKGNLR